MRFREKTYLITLILFLLFLNLGIFSLAYYTYQNNTQSAMQFSKEESRVIAEGFRKDSQYLHLPSAQQLLMRNYCNRYESNNLYLCFWNESIGEPIISNLPEGTAMPKGDGVSSQKINEKRYFVISTPIESTSFILIYAKDVSYLDEDFKRLSAVYVTASIAASAILALFLFLILRKLSMPLEKLRAATEQISDGNFETRAEISGNDEFALLAKDFNRMSAHIGKQVEQLEQSARSKQLMLDNLAHEMRTPLTSIRGYAEYLINANIPEEEKLDSLEFIISESERLKAIAVRLLDESFIEQNRIEPQPVNLGELINELYKKLCFKANERQISLTTATEDVVINCDKLLTELLITNLADNAIKACGQGGRVIISCYKKEDKAFVLVEDNGRGISKDQLPLITEPFYRTDKSRSREDGGIGLGLSLCKRIAEAHNALLLFESELGKGTKATICFTNP